MASEVDIANQALDLLGAETIVSLTQNLENARVINRNYNLVLDSLLRAHNWNCAIRRVVLAPMADAPEFDFDQQFLLPADCLRPIFPNSPRPDWVVENGKILTNEGDTLNLRYIKRLTDPNEMDTCFSDVFAHELAKRIAEKVTQSATKRKLSKEDWEDAWKRAAKANAFEKLPEEQEESSWVQSRVTGPGVDNTRVSRAT